MQVDFSSSWTPRAMFEVWRSLAITSTRASVHWPFLCAVWYLFESRARRCAVERRQPRQGDRRLESRRLFAGNAVLSHLSIPRRRELNALMSRRVLSQYCLAANPKALNSRIFFSLRDVLGPPPLVFSVSAAPGGRGARSVFLRGRREFPFSCDPCRRMRQPGRLRLRMWLPSCGDSRRLPSHANQPWLGATMNRPFRLKRPKFRSSAADPAFLASWSRFFSADSHLRAALLRAPLLRCSPPNFP